MPNDAPKSLGEEGGLPRRTSLRLSLRAATPPQNLLQDQIAAVWERLLCRRHVGIDEEFESLGGGSALRQQMFEELEWLTGERLPQSEPSSGLTIWRASDALVDRLPDEEIIQIQAGDPGVRPLAFLHGDLCGGWYYLRELGRALGAQRPVFAVRQHGMRGEQVPLSIKTMAADHVPRLLRLWPGTAIHLGGFCNGAIVALEVAQQLSRLGHMPMSLLLVEPPLRLTPDVMKIPRLPALSSELRRLPAIRDVWAFMEYRIAINTYLYPTEYDGLAAAIMARDGKLGNVDARTAFRNMAPQGTIMTTPGTHLAVLGRNVRAAGLLLRDYMRQADERNQR
jgi:pimeloyl-ACP methyl ester carboxylesterase